MSTRKRRALLLLAGWAGLLLLGVPAAAQIPGDFMALKGRWVRTDGGYAVEIKSVAADGRIQAAYFNPNPINVSRAEATRQGAAVLVFIELRAPGYPGSTYRLIHDPQSDELKGIYHQAARRQDFDVVFVRGK